MELSELVARGGAYGVDLVALVFRSRGAAMMCYGSRHVLYM